MIISLVLIIIISWKEISNSIFSETHCILGYSDTKQPQNTGLLSGLDENVSRGKTTYARDQFEK